MKRPLWVGIGGLALSGIAVTTAASGAPPPAVVVTGPPLVAPAVIAGAATVAARTPAGVVSVVGVPYGSPAPTGGLTLGGHRLPPNPAGFACDAQGCEFTQMPLYNQTNPNLAYVDVPAAISSHEGNPVTGTVAWDAAANHNAVWLRPNSTAPWEQDPYYQSWLPLGGVTGDDPALGYWLSATCAPTSEAMALMAAIATKSATTVLVPGSWTDVSFLQATAPTGQMPLPSPLHTDHENLAPTQMTAQELQRVINTAVLQGTDPTSGGGGAAFLAQAQSDFRWYAPPGTAGTAPHQVVHTANNARPITPALLVEYLSQRWVVDVGIHRYITHVVANAAAHTRTVTFTIDSSHVIALAGYKGDYNAATFVIHDPVYAHVENLPFTLMGATANAADGTAVSATLPNGNPVEIQIPYDGLPQIADISSLADGQKIWFVHEYSALIIE